MQDIVSGVLGMFMLVALIVMYFLPTILAVSLRRLHVGGIAIINTLLGWTFLGWVAALAWACADSVVPPLEPPSRLPADMIL